VDNGIADFAEPKAVDRKQKAGGRGQRRLLMPSAFCFSIRNSVIRPSAIGKLAFYVCFHRLRRTAPIRTPGK
jgi:hypothetical protein